VYVRSTRFTFFSRQKAFVGTVQLPKDWNDVMLHTLDDFLLLV
jgi:hypothetical protein